MSTGTLESSGRIVSASLSIPRTDPGAFLRLAGGETRGFWARGDRWVAHRGAAARLVSSGSAGRMREVAARAREVASARVGDEAAAEPLRFYGGFSFREDHEAEGFWEGFPAAHFVLPSVELEGRKGEAVLLGRSVVPAGADPDEVAGALAGRLETLSREIRDAPAPGTPPEVRARFSESDRRAWERAVEDVLEAIRSGEVSKVVLARILDVACDPLPDPVDVVSALHAENRGTHVFLYEPRPGQALVGAAPETVVTLRGGEFHATAVAGSIPRGEDPAETEALARTLLESGKDLREHRIALEDMLRRLEPHAEGVRREGEPHVLRLARIQHLETRIEARVPEASALEVLEALHPTPAVCGLPRDAALRLLRREEPFERGWYAGPVGFFDDRGDGVFAPALRSGVLLGDTWRLFAGAGIVEGSVPGREWEETAIKFEPVLRALAAAGAR